MLKELKEDVEKAKKIMCEQNGDIMKQIENLKRNQKGILELKRAIAKMKSSLERFKCRFEQAEERIGELAYRTMKIIESQEQREKRLRKSEQSLGYHQMCKHMHCESPRRIRERERKVRREYLKKYWLKTSPIL